MPTPIEALHHYEHHKGGEVADVVANFGPIHGETLIRDYSECFFAINTEGSGVHPDDFDTLRSEMERAADVLTTKSYTDDSGVFIEVDNSNEVTRLIRDEALTMRLLVGFRTLWPHGLGDLDG